MVMNDVLVLSIYVTSIVFRPLRSVVGLIRIAIPLTTACLIRRVMCFHPMSVFDKYWYLYNLSEFIKRPGPQIGHLSSLTSSTEAPRNKTPRRESNSCLCQIGVATENHSLMSRKTILLAPFQWHYNPWLVLIFSLPSHHAHTSHLKPNRYKKAQPRRIHTSMTS